MSDIKRSGLGEKEIFLCQNFLVDNFLPLLSAAVHGFNNAEAGWIWIQSDVKLQGRGEGIRRNIIFYFAAKHNFADFQDSFIGFCWYLPAKFRGFLYFAVNQKYFAMKNIANLQQQKIFREIWNFDESLVEGSFNFKLLRN